MPDLPKKMINLPMNVNKTLFPLKLTLFFFAASTFSILPYLTIHMKDIGISDIDVALIYTILPFFVLIAPPVVGFFGDRLGNYTRVLQLNVVMTGVFHTLLLFVPHSSTRIFQPDASLTLDGGRFGIKWGACVDGPETPMDWVTQKKMYLEVTGCVVSCNHTSHDNNICHVLNIPNCKYSEKMDTAVMYDLVPRIKEEGVGWAGLDLLMAADPCHHSKGDEEGLLIKPMGACTALCPSLSSNVLPECREREQEGRMVTNTVYFLLRMVSTMALASTFIMLDAQTIQMCTMEEAAGNKGAYGRQILYKTLAQAMISPLVGLMMDWISEMTGSTNYAASFIICDFLLLATFISICLIQQDIGLPKDSDTFGGVRLILNNPSCLIFMFMMFVCGNMYGFVETFLFIYLKEDLNAPIFLLGLTITTGALVSVPFLYYSDKIVNKFGVINIIILAMLMYGVRYVGYSFITCAWYAFPFEALEVFTLFLFTVGKAKFIQSRAPPGTLATMTGMAGGAHYGFGKGMGGLIGGLLKSELNSTAMAFRVFGIGAFIFGLLYAVFHFTYGKRVDRKLEEIIEAELQTKPCQEEFKGIVLKTNDDKEQALTLEKPIIKKSSFTSATSLERSSIESDERVVSKDQEEGQEEEKHRTDQKVDLKADRLSEEETVPLV